MFDQVSLKAADAEYLILCPQSKEIRELLAMDWHVIYAWLCITIHQYVNTVRPTTPICKSSHPVGHPCGCVSSIQLIFCAKETDNYFWDDNIFPTFLLAVMVYPLAYTQALTERGFSCCFYWINKIFVPVYLVSFSMLVFLVALCNSYNCKEPLLSGKMESLEQTEGCTFHDWYGKCRNDLWYCEVPLRYRTAVDYTWDLETWVDQVDSIANSCSPSGLSSQYLRYCNS